MLNIHIIEEGLPEDICMDMKKEFAMTTLDGRLEDRKIIEEIEEGQYNTEIDFIDRFGYKLYNTELSTGTKAALTIIHNPNKKYFLGGAGINAISTIMRYCREGNIWIYDPIIGFESFLGSDIDVMFEGIHFTDMNELNFYIDNERI